MPSRTVKNEQIERKRNDDDETQNHLGVSRLIQPVALLLHFDNIFLQLVDVGLYSVFLFIYQPQVVGQHIYLGLLVVYISLYLRSQVSLYLQVFHLPIFL